MNMQRFGLVALAGTMALLSACAKSTTSAGPSPTPTPTVAATSPSPSPTPTPTASASPTATAAGVVVVHTGTTTVSGKSETVLTSAQGFTLYYHTTDTPTSVCSGACAVPGRPSSFPRERRAARRAFRGRWESRPTSTAGRSPTMGTPCTAGRTTPARAKPPARESTTSMW
jgi:hypothetical protein